MEEYKGLYIPVYIAEVPGKDLAVVAKEFKGKEEFVLNILEGRRHAIKPVQEWGNIVKAIETSMANDDDVMIYCSHDHRFLPGYERDCLFSNIYQCRHRGTHILIGGGYGIERAIDSPENLFRISYFSWSPFIVIFREVFQEILETLFDLQDNVGGKLSSLFDIDVFDPLISSENAVPGEYLMSVKSESREPLRFIEMPENNESISQERIIVLIPFYNADQFLNDCYESIVKQSYDNFEAFFLDDCSDDAGLENIPEEDSRVHKIGSAQRVFSLANLYHCLKRLKIPDETIIVLLDGDDFLRHNQVFCRINEIYKKEQCLLCYGQYYTSTRDPGHCRHYTPEEFKILRKKGWRASHLKTFKFQLFREFCIQDPFANAFKDKRGNFYEMTSDIAIMTPLMEIAGFENVFFNKEINYVYRYHPENDHKRNLELQLKIEAEIRTKPNFKCVF